MYVIIYKDSKLKMNTYAGQRYNVVTKRIELVAADEEQRATPLIFKTESVALFRMQQLALKYNDLNFEIKSDEYFFEN